MSEARQTSVPVVPSPALGTVGRHLTTISLRTLALRVLHRDSLRDALGTLRKSETFAGTLPAYAHEERPAVDEFDTGIPRAWTEGFARLDPNNVPTGVPPKRWQQFVADVGSFLNGWAARATALGWGPEDLFGAHSSKPFERIDSLGLLWLLNGARVVALTEDTAAIENAAGVRHAYRRKPHIAGRIMAWELNL